MEKLKLKNKKEINIFAKNKKNSFQKKMLYKKVSQNNCFKSVLFKLDLFCN